MERWLEDDGMEHGLTVQCRVQQLTTHTRTGLFLEKVCYDGQRMRRLQELRDPADSTMGHRAEGIGPWYVLDVPMSVKLGRFQTEGDRRT